MSRALGMWLGVSDQKCKIPPRSLRGDIGPAVGGAVPLPVPILCTLHLLAYLSPSQFPLSHCPYPQSHPHHFLFLS